MPGVETLVGRPSVVPESTAEYGALIYQEPWAYERRMPAKYDLLRIAGIDVFATFILLFGVAIALEKMLDML